LRDHLNNGGAGHVKIIFDGPVHPEDDAYWVGDDMADLTGTDVYFFDFGATSEQQWEDYSNCGQATIPCAPNALLGHLANWGAAHHKPIVISEWCDAYADAVILPKFAQWMSQSNVVAQTYWNSTDGTGPNCPINASQAKIDAYKAAFGVPYSGGFWTHLATHGWHPNHRRHPEHKPGKN
jgi:hypothetical protein